MGDPKTRYATPTAATPRRPFFYGYVIVAMCFLNLVLVGGLMAGFSVFNVALLEAFRWSRAGTATIASVNGLAYSVLAPVAGWAYDRLGPRILMPLGCALVGLGLVLASRSDSLWQFYLCYGVLAGFGTGCIDFVGTTAVLSHWFRRRRATAIGFAAMGLGVGIVIVPGVQILITVYGWRGAMALLGASVLVSLVPLNALFQRRRPEDIGQLPDGDLMESLDIPDTSTETVKSSPARPATRHDWTLAQVLSSFPFWAIATGHLAVGMSVSLMFTHTVAHLIHVGLDKLAAASVFSLVGVARIPGTAMWGFASDRLGRGQAYRLGILMALGGVGLLMALGPEAPPWWFVAFALLYGLGHSASAPTYASTIADIFWGRNVATIVGLLEVTFGLGFALGTWFGGFAYDVTGSYRYAWILVLLSLALTYAGIHASLIWQRRFRPDPP